MPDGAEVDTDLNGLRPVAIATRTSVTPSSGSAPTTRVTASRARRERTEMRFRSTGSRPIGRSMRRPPLHEAPDEGGVLLVHLPVGELSSELGVRAIVLGHDHQPRRPAVETVHDARPQLAADAAQILYVVQELR